MPRPDHPLVAILNVARDAGVGLTIRGDELIVTAFAPEPGLIDALRCHKAALQILCRASAELGVRLTWSAAQLCVDDDPAHCGYPAMRHFLEQRFIGEEQRRRFGLLPDETEPHQPYRSADGNTSRIMHRTKRP